MLRALRRLRDDVVCMWTVAPRRQTFRWYFLLLLNVISITRTGKLYQADMGMTGNVHFRLYEQDFEFDISLLNSSGGNAFTFLRELFVRRIYFRAFQNLRFSCCVDLGCNIGIVSQVLEKLAGPEGRVIAVDAQTFQDNQFRAYLSDKYNITFDQRLLCGDCVREDRKKLLEMRAMFNFDTPLFASIDEIIVENKLDRIDFMKMDIEGAEFEIFADPAEWLHRVDNLAMEVHPDRGDPQAVLSRLREKGFDVCWCDNFGYVVEPRYAWYIYASRTGALRSNFN